MPHLLSFLLPPPCCAEAPPSWTDLTLLVEQRQGRGRGGEGLLWVQSSKGCPQRTTYLLASREHLRLLGLCSHLLRTTACSTRRGLHTDQERTHIPINSVRHRLPRPSGRWRGSRPIAIRGCGYSDVHFAARLLPDFRSLVSASHRSGRGTQRPLGPCCQHELAVWSNQEPNAGTSPC